METFGYLIDTSLTAEKNKWLISCSWPSLLKKSCCGYRSEELVVVQDRGRSYHQKSFKVIELVKITLLKGGVSRQSQFGCTSHRGITAADVNIISRITLMTSFVMLTNHFVLVMLV